MRHLFNFLLAVIVAGLLAGCSAASKEDDKKARLEKLKQQHADLGKEIQNLQEQVAKEYPADESNIKAKEVVATEVAPRQFNHYVQTQGSVESENNILVSSKAPGVITQVFVSEGEQVSKGQVLAQIDNSVIANSIQSMEANLELATSVFERQEKLWNQKIGTEVQYLQAKTNKESLEKQLASLREQNDMYRIKAPISGTVDAVNAKVGEATQPGMPAFRVVNGNDLKLHANVSEAYVTNVKKGNKVIVQIPELKKDLVATVTFAGRTIDALSRTFDVEANLPPNEDVRPNMTATVKVIFNSVDSAIVIPVNIIQQINDEKIVYVAEPSGKNTIARKKVITVNGVFGGDAHVEGLKAGDKVITFGYQGLNDGDYVRI